LKDDVWASLRVLLWRVGVRKGDDDA
jgi:hypothetical protein